MLDVLELLWPLPSDPVGELLRFLSFGAMPYLLVVRCGAGPFTAGPGSLPDTTETGRNGFKEPIGVR
ncbi:hypothetical protein OHB56_22865 [Streptomyces sp. NBC_01635]|uniref:hypothetical protein n=1 Tax=Streptomyces sp. NBC_01635 TaxID=2975904 RepID=UPI00386F89F5|nr:hypothetical protein OHB56_22865 [Streptomyces sp. NBC_01635]